MNRFERRISRLEGWRPEEPELADLPDGDLLARASALAADELEEWRRIGGEDRAARLRRVLPALPGLRATLTPDELEALRADTDSAGQP